jgi:F-type H+-transporting ATPase subunit b
MDNPLVQPDPGLFIWTILTFLVLVALLAKFAWRPLLDALEARRALIAKSLEDAQKARQELERLQRESAEMMRQARVEAESIVSRSRSDAEALREELKQKSRAEAAAIVKNAEKQIQLETARAIQQIRSETVDLSVAIASKILKRQVTKEDHEGLIEDTLKQVETRRHV